MRAASTLFAIGTALWLTASSAHAVGFGRVSNATQLGQPLNFAAAVRLGPDETLARDCVAAEVQSGDNKLQPGQVRVTLEGAADSLDRSVRVTTSTLIDEPVVTVSVTLGCNAKVTRKFIAFIDPPVINAAQTMPLDALPQQRFDSQVAPLVSIVQGDSGAAQGAQRSERSGAKKTRARAAAPIVGNGFVAETVVASQTDKNKRAARPSRQPAVARATQPRSRLQLEAAAPPVVARAASSADTATATATVAATAAAAETTTATSVLPVPAARPVPPSALAVAEPASSAASDAAAPLLSEERQRIQSLEDSFAKMRSESQATQTSIVALQARIKAAESERYANPLVYVLAGLSGLLAFTVAGLWWRQSRGPNSSPWWNGPSAMPASADAAASARRTTVVDPLVSAPQPLGSPQTAADAFAISTPISDEAAAPLEPTRPSPFVTLAPSIAASPVADDTPRELSVEELIDLEQQAEFFIVLGQDEAAIELLMSHVRSDGGISPLPYLKLLEIYRRRSEKDAYQRIRERFNLRFNSYAPDWDSDLQQGRSLVEYPDTIERLQQLWPSPVRAMETLDASLFRRNKTDDTFDLPAYRELLFLYSIARDLAEQAGVLPATQVDLLLPMGEPGEEPIARLSAMTRPSDFQASDMMTLPLDLDVSFAPAAPVATQEFETVPSALRRSAGMYFSSDSNLLDFDLDGPAQPVATPRAGGNR